jgi:mannose/cellobiose epimerase-like protein (N-acyl-D-glucosamine 2-epimerase family)
LTDQRRSLIETACREMPRLLIQSCRFGWNSTHGGLHKAVDTQSGKVLNGDMPWWNLPETMRAAVRAYEVAGETKTRDRCLEILRDCHNAYFEKYLNRDNMLFPVQTISGATGKVVDKVPAVPEGDPLYHTNLALLEMLDVLARL